MARKKRKPGRRASGKAAPPLSATELYPTQEAMLAAADRYDARVAARQQREDAIWKETKQQLAKIANQLPAFTVSQKSKDAIARYAPRPKPWSGDRRTWLLGRGDWRGAFVEYPLRSNEKVWAPLRHDDYCRRIEREALKVGLVLAASYIKKVHLDHS